MAPNGGGSAELGSGDGVRRAIMSLPPDQVTADLNACVEYVAKLPACNGKVAVGGFCWGGGQTFRFATNNKTIKAAFAFYGTGPEKQEDLERITCPVFGLYGENDVAWTNYLEVDRAYEKVGQSLRAVTYEGSRAWICL